MLTLNAHTIQSLVLYSKIRSTRTKFPKQHHQQRGGNVRTVLKYTPAKRSLDVLDFVFSVDSFINVSIFKILQK
jgi:hypothetical protein